MQEQTLTLSITYVLTNMSRHHTLHISSSKQVFLVEYVSDVMNFQNSKFNKGWINIIIPGTSGGFFVQDNWFFVLCWLENIRYMATNGWKKIKLQATGPQKKRKVESE